MRDISTNLKTHFGQECTTIATIWKLTRTDNVVMGFTNHDEDIVYDGVTYLASTGFLPSDIAVKSDFSVANQEIESYLDSSAITDEDLLNGVYDYAEVQVMYINYESVADGVLIGDRGWVGQVQIRGEQFAAEVRGLSEKPNQKIGQIFSPLCRAKLGDSKCGANLTNFTFNDEVDVVDSDFPKQAFRSYSLLQEAGYFTSGEVEWTSGPNTGLKMEIKEFSNGVVTLSLPMPKEISKGHQYTIVAGCGKDKDTCINKFNNFINFRGEPDVPGQDAIFETAGTFKR